MMAALSAVGLAIMVMGALIFAVAGMGLWRLPDVYTRASAVATASGLGIALLLVGLFCQMPSWGNLFKLIATLTLQLITSSVAAVVLARAGYLTGSRMSIEGRMRRPSILPPPDVTAREAKARGARERNRQYEDPEGTRR